MTPLAASLRAFGRETRGTVAVFVALSAATLVTVTGMSVDLVRATFAKNELQQAVDATTLAVASEQVPNTYTTDATIAAYLAPIAQGYFDANFAAGSNATSVDPISLTVNTAANTVAISVSGSMQTMMLQMINKPTVPMSAEATAERTQPGPIEMVLSLDYTWSMTDQINGEQKIVSMKRAATNLVNALMVTDDIKIGIVPFASWINIGTSYNAQSWINVPAGYDRTYSSYSCTTPITYSCNLDGVPSTCGTSVPCPGATQRFWVQRFDYQGCIISRRAGYQDNQTDPSVKYDGILMTCVPLTIRDLTARTESSNTGKALVTNKIASINPMNHGYVTETFIPSGLLWGWNMLTPEQPLDKAVSKATAEQLGLRKVLVLMTDGKNSVMVNSTGTNFTAATDATAVNKLTSDLCTNIKNDGIIIYTVNFAVADAATNSMLKNCASEPTYYYTASNADQLAAAFDRIGKSLRPVRLLQ